MYSPSRGNASDTLRRVVGAALGHAIKGGESVEQVVESYEHQ